MSEAQSIDSELILRAWTALELTTKTALHIGALESAAEAEASEDEALHDSETKGPPIRRNTLAVMRGEGQRALIPGSSLRGCLRALYQVAFPNQVEDLFGRAGSDDDQCSGRLQLGCALSSDTLNQDSSDCLQQGHARDPVTNTVQDSMLYQREIVPAGHCFEVTLIVNNTCERELAQLHHVLRQIPQEALGAAKRSGLGRFEPLDAEDDIRTQVVDSDAVKRWLSEMQLRPLQDVATSLAVDAQLADALEQPGRRWQVALLPQAAFHIGTGLSESRDGCDIALPQLHQGLAIVPGKALKGALRAAAGRLLMSALYRLAPALPAGAISAAAARSVADTVLQVLFGGEGQAGCLWVDDLLSPVVPKSTDRYFNAIDRFTGGTADGKLFSIKALYCTRLEGEIRWRPLPRVQADPEQEAALLQLLAAVLADADNCLYLGGSVGRGLGEMQLHMSGGSNQELPRCDTKGWGLLQAWLEQLCSEQQESVA